MSEDLNRELSFGGTPVGVLLQRDASRLVTTILESLVTEVELYRSLPADVIDVDVRQVIHENLKGFRDALRQHSAPTPDMVATATASAYRRAEEGIAQEAVVAAYLTAAHEAWRLVTASSQPNDVADLHEVTDLMIGFLRSILSAVCRAYTEEMRRSYAEEIGVRNHLLGALLSGDSPAEAALLAGIELPAAYTVVAVAVAPGAATDSITRRRQARQLRAAVHILYADDALVSVDDRGGVVLIPGLVPDHGTPTSLETLAREISVATATPAMLGAVTASPSEVGAAAQQAREILDVARRSGRPGSVFRLNHLLLEFHLSQTSAASPHLAALLAPLASNPDLVPTLEVHLANGLDRRATASALNVHPNTVDYRMQRIRLLTGLDPSVPTQSAVLLAAIAAHGARERGPGA